MRHVFKSIAKFIKSIFATPKWRYITIVGIVVLAVIISTVVALAALSREKSNPGEDPIESYDKITEIEIGFDEETTTINRDTAEPETSVTTDDSTDATSFEATGTEYITENTAENSVVTETAPKEEPTPTDPSTDSVQTDPTPVDTTPNEYYEPTPVETTTQAEQTIPQPTETTTKEAETQPKPVETTAMEPVKVPIEDETYDNVYEIIIG